MIVQSKFKKYDGWTDKWKDQPTDVPTSKVKFTRLNNISLPGVGNEKFIRRQGSWSTLLFSSRQLAYKMIDDIDFDQMKITWYWKSALIIRIFHHEKMKYKDYRLHQIMRWKSKKTFNGGSFNLWTQTTHQLQTSNAG